MTTLLKIVPELRNSIINGNFDFWQRQTSFSISGSVSAYTADRFKYNSGSVYTATVARSTDVPTAAQSGFASAFSYLVTNGTGSAPGSGEFAVISHLLEGLDYQNFHNKKFRIQFWAKSSVTGTFALSLRNGSANRYYLAPFTIVSSGVWQKISIDVQGDSTGTWPLDNSIGLVIGISLGIGSSFQSATTGSWAAGNFFGITGQTQWGATTGATFQLAQIAMYPITAGTGIDLPFFRVGRTISDELRMCQRYYHKSYEVDTIPGTVTVLGAHGVSSTSAFGSTSRWAVVKFVNSMRTAPSVQTRSANGTINAAFGLNSPATDIVNGAQVSGGGTSAEGFIVTNQSGSALTSDSAQMYQFHWAADAEL